MTRKQAVVMKEGEWRTMVWILLAVFLAAVVVMLWTGPGRVSAAPVGREATASDLADFLAPFKAKLLASERLAVEILLEPMADDDVHASKVGGRPYWPTGQALPAGENGESLFLLAQVNFDELPAPIPGYPATGMLQFFIADTDSYGANFDGRLSAGELVAPRNHRVVYWPDVAGEGATLPERHSDRLPHDPSQPRRMRFSARTEPLSVGDYRFDGMLGGDLDSVAAAYAARAGVDADTLTEALWQGNQANGHKLGGYPFFTQQDPRSDGPWELLLQLDTDDHMMWGDTGVGNFFIDPQDLARTDFSRVIYNWDCY